MSEQAQQDEQDRRLWRQYLAAAGRRPEAPAVDANDLAAYLDGTADPAAVERVQSAMASDPGLLDEVMELRALTGAQVGPVAPSVLRKAKALVGAEVRPVAAVVIRAGQWWRRLQWAAAAAVVVVSSLGGYSFGRDTFLAQSRADAAAAQASQELQAEDDVSDLGVPGQVNGGNGGGS